MADDSAPGEDSARGGVFDHAAAVEEDSPGAVSVIEPPDTLVVELPLISFTRTALDNLDKMVTSKAALIQKAIGVPASDGVDDLPIEQTETTLRFP